MPIRAVLFDKDGTLVDIQATLGPATCDVLRWFSGGDDALLARLADMTRVDLNTRRLKPGCPVISEATDIYGTLWAGATGKPYSAEVGRAIDGKFLETTLTHLHPVGDPRAVLTALADQDYALGIMTNDADANTRAQLRRLAIDHLTPFVAGYDSGHGQKPDAAPVLAFAAAAGVAPHEIAVVGDSPHDLLAARAAGSVAVGVLSGPNGADVLAPLADVLLGSVAELPSWLCSRNAEALT